MLLFVVAICCGDLCCCDCDYEGGVVAMFCFVCYFYLLFHVCICFINFKFVVLLVVFSCCLSVVFAFWFPSTNLARGLFLENFQLVGPHLTMLPFDMFVFVWWF